MRGGTIIRFEVAAEALPKRTSITGGTVLVKCCLIKMDRIPIHIPTHAVHRLLSSPCFTLLKITGCTILLELIRSVYISPYSHTVVPFHTTAIAPLDSATDKETQRLCAHVCEGNAVVLSVSLSGQSRGRPSPTQ